MSTDFASSGPADATPALAGSVSLPLPAVSVSVPTAIPVTFYPFESPTEIRIPAAANTWEGFRQWALSDEYPERCRITYLDGELIVDMSPESFEEQGAVKAEVCRVLTQLVRDRGLGYLRIDRTLVSNETASLSSEPDAVLVTPQSIQSGRVKFTPSVDRPQSSKEIVGTVDWVLEIISPSSRRKDSKLLRAAYFAAGVPEYWLVDPTDNDTVGFEILVRGERDYVAAESVHGWQQSHAFGSHFRLVRGRDPLGYWQYTLEMKSNA